MIQHEPTDWIRPPTNAVVVETTTVLVSDEEEQRLAEEELERALSRAMCGAGAPPETTKVPAPPQRLPSSIVPADDDLALPKRKRCD